MRPLIVIVNSMQYMGSKCYDRFMTDDLDELYTQFGDLDKEDPRNREEVVKVMAAITTLEANELLEGCDDELKLELLVESTGEALIGVLKAYLLFRPELHPNKLAKRFCESLTTELSNWFPKDETIN